ncbi:hypothetical protein AB9M62_25265 [Bacillales bacterium AN1005]
MEWNDLIRNIGIIVGAFAALVATIKNISDMMEKRKRVLEEKKRSAKRKSSKNSKR